MKFCTNCKHMNGNNLCSFPIDNDDVRDVVIGTPLECAQPPWLMRSSEAYCGGAGKWYELDADRPWAVKRNTVDQPYETNRTPQPYETNRT